MESIISDYLEPPQTQLPVWHLVGGLDALDRDELDGKEPDDGYPTTLEDWINNDGLNCLKIKLTGIDWDWDYDTNKKFLTLEINLVLNIIVRILIVLLKILHTSIQC